MSAVEMNPKDILYSTPTINDALPDHYLPRKVDKNTAIIHEDPQIAANVAAFMRNHELGLIYWRSRSVFISPEAVEKYLATGA